MHDDNLRHRNGWESIFDGYEADYHPVGVPLWRNMAYLQAHFLPSDITDRPNPENMPNIAQSVSAAPTFVTQDPSDDVTPTADVASTINEPCPSTTTWARVPLVSHQVLGRSWLPSDQIISNQIKSKSFIQTHQASKLLNKVHRIE